LLGGLVTIYNGTLDTSIICNEQFLSANGILDPNTAVGYGCEFPCYEELGNGYCGDPENSRIAVIEVAALYTVDQAQRVGVVECIATDLSVVGGIPSSFQLDIRIQEKAWPFIREFQIGGVSLILTTPLLSHHLLINLVSEPYKIHHRK